MSQRIPGPGEEILPLPDFHDDVDIFASTPPLRPRRSRMRMVLGLLILLLVLAGIIVFVIKYRTHIVFQTQKATQGDVVLNFNASGSLRTNVYTINFIGSGKLAEIDVSVGQQIKKNQILAKMDPTSLQNAVNEAQANVDAAQTALDNANANYQAIQFASPSVTESQPFASAAVLQATDGIGSSENVITTPQAEGGFPPPVATPSSITTSPHSITTQTDKQVQLIEASGRVKAAQKALTLAQAQLASAKYNLNNMVLRAPHNGTVAAVNGAVGGEPGTPFIQLADSSQQQLQVNVRESNISAVAVGDAVTFTVDAYPEQVFDGNVVAITPLSQVVAGDVTYPVLVNMVTSVPGTVHLLSGMTAHATITTDQRTDVVRIPAKALTFAQASVKARPETDNRRLVSPAQMDDAFARANILLQNLQQDATQGQAKAAVVLEREGPSTIVVMPIVVGLTDGKQYEVLDGLSANDVVLVGAQMGHG